MPRTFLRLTPLAALLLAIAIGSCSSPTKAYLFKHYLLGHVRVIANLADAGGNPTGTREIEDAYGIHVSLLGASDVTNTIAGDYIFHIAQGTYAAVASVAGIATDTTRAIYLNTDIITSDTMKVAPHGSLTSSPNPFTGATALRFPLAADGQVVLRIVGLDGILVRTLLNGMLPAGVHIATWDGKNDAAVAAADGPYIAVLITPADTSMDVVIKGP